MSDCTIQRAVQETEESITDRLLKIDGATILAVGPPGCLRFLYFRAREIGCLHKLRLCTLTKNQYASGGYLSKIEDSLNAALSDSRIKALIIYISCPDILLQTDFERQLRRCHGAGNIPVELFRRGPMVKRHLNINGEIYGYARRASARLRSRIL